MTNLNLYSNSFGWQLFPIESCTKMSIMPTSAVNEAVKGAEFYFS